MTLRTRLTIALVALAAVGLLLSDVVTYRALRAFLHERLDQQVLDLAVRVTTDSGTPRGFRLPLRDDIQVVAPDGTWAGTLEADGTLKPRFTPLAPGPDLQPEHLDGRFHTVNNVNGTGRLRIVARPALDGQLWVFAIPLRDVNLTLGRLVAIEVLATIAILAAVGLVARFLVRRGLRPLEDIGETAGAIAAGDLSQRVDVADEQTEVGQLGMALNTMLGQIEMAFDAQHESENRLRRFVADASHELRTPLTSIRGYAELFRRGASERPDDLAKSMRRIEEEATRMGVLVDDLLLLARLDQGRPLAREPVDLARLASDAVDDARAVDASRVITLDATAGTTVDGDDAGLRQVIANLLSNTRQHTPAGTPVHVTVRTDDGVAVLEVADEGPGLTAEQASRVFERFYRADEARSGGGTGLGLAIVAAVTEAHGGTATVASSPGQGARFSVRLPLEGARSGANRPSSPTRPPARSETQSAE
ncbi:MAG: sensor histidine kinase [Acidimicrobiales bacterium]